MTDTAETVKPEHIAIAEQIARDASREEIARFHLNEAEKFESQAAEAEARDAPARICEHLDQEAKKHKAWADAILSLSLSPQGDGMRDNDPHPRWKPGQSDRHPQSVEEWDYRQDPVGGAFQRSLRRLNVAVDYDDPRAPDQMALVLRTDVLRLIHDWTHKNAAFECFRDRPHGDGWREIVERCAQIAEQCNVRIAAPRGGMLKDQVALARSCIAAAIRALPSPPHASAQEKDGKPKLHPGWNDPQSTAYVGEDTVAVIEAAVIADQRQGEK